MGPPARRALRRDERSPLLPALLDPAVAVGDLGCGSGRIAAALAPFAGSVVAVDSSPEMLDVARSRLAAFDNVRIVEGRIEQLPLEPTSLDLALVVHLLHHVADPSAALAEVARVLRPGGRLVIADVLPIRTRSTAAQWATSGSASAVRRSRRSSRRPASTGERWHEAGIEPGARGPAMFVATAIRPPAHAQKKKTIHRREA